jgi:hypothetical protein
MRNIRRMNERILPHLLTRERVLDETRPLTVLTGNAQPVVGVGYLDTIVGGLVCLIGRLFSLLGQVGNLVSSGTHDGVFGRLERFWDE